MTISTRLVSCFGESTPPKQKRSGLRPKPLVLAWLCALGLLPGSGLGSAQAASPLQLTKGQITLNFAQSQKDTASCSGTLRLSSPVTLAGLTVDFAIGGATQEVVLDAKGRSPKGTATVLLRAAGFKATDTIPAGTALAFTLTARSNLAPVLKLGGVAILTNTTSKPFALASLNVRLSLAGTDYVATAVPGAWRATPNRAGNLALAKSPATLPALSLSTNLATPGQWVTLKGTFNPKRQYQVLLADDTGYETHLLPRRCAPTVWMCPCRPT